MLNKCLGLRIRNELRRDPDFRSTAPSLPDPFRLLPHWYTAKPVARKFWIMIDKPDHDKVFELRIGSDFIMQNFSGSCRAIDQNQFTAIMPRIGGIVRKNGIEQPKAEARANNGQQGKQ